MLSRCLATVLLASCAGTDYLTDFSATTPDGRVHVVVEIPAGTNEKWEVDKANGALAWERHDGRGRVVQYLPYPANYGMVPRTRLPKSAGGDGDPLDVLLLGPGVPRGSVIAARLVGVLRCVDGGEQDDKLIAVAPGSPFAAVRDLDELEARFPGVLTILETFLAHYKGGDRMVVRGRDGPEVARELLEAARRAFASHR